MTDSADAMVQNALFLQRQNRIPEAIDAYQRVLARWPGRAECWFNLGFLQRQVRDVERALYSYQKALEHGIDRPEDVHLNRSVIYADYLHQHAAAEHELKLAVRLNADYVPVLLNYATLCEDLGRRPEAIAWYSRILELDGTCFEALARLANLQPPDTGPAALAPLRRAMAHPAATASDRASLGFALGRLLDAQGDYPQAFEAFTAANRDSRASAGPHVVGYEPTWQQILIDRLIAGGTAPAAARGPVSAAAAPSPIFICGMFRSGSTLTEQLLASLPGIAPGGELDFLPRLVEGELAPFPQSLALLTAERCADIAARYRAALAQASGGAARVTDKRPDNFFYIGLIKALFPDARIVHTTRNPLDNCLSIFCLHLDQVMNYALDLKDIGHYYREYRRLMAHWKATFPGDIYDFDYDALVADPEPVLRGLCMFLSIEWDGRIPQPAPIGRSVKTASAWQVREPLYRRSSGRAQHYGSQLDELRGYLADFL